MNTYQIEQFMAFLDFISDPKKIKAQVEEAKAATETLKEEREKHRQIRDVDNYRAEVLADLQKRDSLLDEKSKALEAKKVEFQKIMQESNADLDEREQKFQKRYKELESVAQQAETVKADMEALAQASKDLDESRQQLAIRMAAVKKREDQLASVLKGVE